MQTSKMIHRLANAPRRAAMRLHALRVQIVLALGSVQDQSLRAVTAVRNMPSGRLLAATTLALAFLTPSTLYINERARRAEMTRAYQNLSFSSTAEIATLRHNMGNLLYEQSEIKGLLLDLGYAVYSDNEVAVPVLATGYSSTVLETDATPFITAANTRTRQGIVALSRDLLRRYTEDAPFDFGDVVHISGLGDFIVEDSMNARWKRRVDVWFPSRTAAVTFGRREAVIHRLRPKALDGANQSAGKGETAYRYALPMNLAASP